MYDIKKQFNCNLQSPETDAHFNLFPDIFNDENMLDFLIQSNVSLTLLTLLKITIINLLTAYLQFIIIIIYIQGEQNQQSHDEEIDSLVDSIFSSQEHEVVSIFSTIKCSIINKCIFCCKYANIICTNQII